MRADCDRLLLVFRTLDFEPFCPGVLDDHRELIGPDGVQHREEIRPINLAALAEAIRQVLHYFRVVLVVLVESFDANFGPAWHGHESDLLQREQRLFFGQNLAQKIFSHA